MNKSTSAVKKGMGTLAIPVLFAAILLLLCAIGGKSMIANAASFNNFVIYTAIVMTTTMALSINLNSGRFDFSLGSMAVLASVLSAKVSFGLLAGGTGSAWLMLALNLVFGALLGLASGALYVTIRIPPIITSLGVTLIFEGVTYTITGGKYVMKEVQNPSMAAFTGTWVYAFLLILAVLAVTVILFDHTRFGYNYRALRDGQKVAVETGVREVPNALACYAICGALMGVVGFLNTVRNTNINGGSLNFGSIAIMFTAFLPMFIGGYIGRFSNDKLGYLLAAVCMSMLNSTFAAFSNEVTASTQSIINAVLLVLFLIYLNNEHIFTRLLRPVKRK